MYLDQQHLNGFPVPGTMFDQEDIQKLRHVSMPSPSVHNLTVSERLAGGSDLLYRKEFAWREIVFPNVEEGRKSRSLSDLSTQNAHVLITFIYLGVASQKFLSACSCLLCPALPQHGFVCPGGKVYTLGCFQLKSCFIWYIEMLIFTLVFETILITLILSNSIMNIKAPLL